MKWTDMQHAEMARRFESGGTQAVADYAVELVRARGGTMTADDLAQALYDVSAGDSAEADFTDTWGHQIFEHLSSQGATVATLQAEVEEFERLARQHHAGLVEVTAQRDALRSEMERLKGWREKCINDNNAWATRLTAAESRLAAIRERAGNRVEAGHRLRMAIVWTEPNRSWCAAKYEDRATEFARWVLDGDAPNSPGILEGSNDPDETCDECGEMGGQHRHLPVYGDELPRMCSQAKRYPCSDTCTHDDAAKVGHPERIAARRKALATEDDGGVLASDEPHTDRAEERSEALKAATDHGGYEAAFIAGEERGAEAMRAAAEKWAREYFGDVPPTLKQALDEVAP